MTEIIETLKKIKEEFAKLNELLSQLDPEKAVNALVMLSQLCSCDTWEQAMAYRFLLPPESKKQVEVLRQIYYMRMSNFIFQSLPELDELFRQVAREWNKARNQNNSEKKKTGLPQKPEEPKPY